MSAFGDTVEALRVRPYTPKLEIYCEECGDVIKATGGKSPKQIAASTKSKYGVELCAACATQKFEEMKEEATDENNED